MTRRPVSRPAVVAGALVLLGLVAGIVAMAELLRHPPPGTDPAREPAGDPRDELVCARPPLGDVVEATTDVLYDCPREWDGRTVRYTGEAVGAILRRREGAWVQLNDDVYAGDLGPLPAHRVFRGGNAGIGVYLPTALADEIAFVGGPAYRGDHVEVVGTFHRVDADSSEVVVIRATEGRVVREGEPFRDPVLRDRRLVALVLVPTALLLLVYERRRTRRF